LGTELPVADHHGPRDGNLFGMHEQPYFPPTEST
jgi:hypothetical protein